MNAKYTFPIDLMQLKLCMVVMLPGAEIDLYLFRGMYYCIYRAHYSYAFGRDAAMIDTFALLAFTIDENGVFDIRRYRPTKKTVENALKLYGFDYKDITVVRSKDGLHFCGV